MAKIVYTFGIHRTIINIVFHFVGILNHLKSASLKATRNFDRLIEPLKILAIQ